jgi:hypothetical protein
LIKIELKPRHLRRQLFSIVPVTSPELSFIVPLPIFHCPLLFSFHATAVNTTLLFLLQAAHDCVRSLFSIDRTARFFLLFL